MLRRNWPNSKRSAWEPGVAWGFGHERRRLVCGKGVFYDLAPLTLV